MVIVFTRHHEALLLLKTTWKTADQLCYSLLALKHSSLHALPCAHHERAPAQSSWGLGILEGEGIQFLSFNQERERNI